MYLKIKVQIVAQNRQNRQNHKHHPWLRIHHMQKQQPYLLHYLKPMQGTICWTNQEQTYRQIWQALLQHHEK